MSKRIAPAKIVTPGKSLARALAMRKWSQADLDRACGWGRGVARALIRGEKPIDRDVARALAKAFGTSTKCWIMLVENYVRDAGKTSDVIELLNRRIGDDPENREKIADARLRGDVAQALYDAIEAAGGVTRQRIARACGKSADWVQRVIDADFSLAIDLIALRRAFAACGARMGVTCERESVDDRALRSSVKPKRALVLPPGWHLKRALEARKLTPAQFARRIGYRTRDVMAVLRAKAPITPAMSAAISQEFGTSSGYWWRLSANYESWKARKKD